MEICPLVIKFCRLALAGPVIMTQRVHASASVHTAAIFCVLFKLEDRKKHMHGQDPGPGEFLLTQMLTCDLFAVHSC